MIWKQLLAVMLLLLSFSYLETANLNHGGAPKLALLQRLLLVTAIILAIASFLNGLPLLRIAYGSIAYLGFAGALGFAHVCLIRNRLLQTLNLFFYVALLCSFGIVLDYFFPLFDFLPRVSGNEFETQIARGYLRRASFFFGASTTVYPFLSFSIASIAITLQKAQTKTNITKFVVLASSTAFATYLTGSRANFLLLLAFLAAVFFIAFSFLTLSKKALLLIPFFFLPASLDLVFGFIYQGEGLAARYADAFSSNASGNIDRFEAWSKGWALFSELGMNFIVGNGVGSSLGMLNDGFPNTGHYESSFFQGFSEGGTFGLVLRYLPLLFASAVLILQKRPWSAIEKIIFLWLALYFASVFVSPTAAAYHTQFVYFFVCGVALQMRLVRKIVDNSHQEIMNNGSLEIRNHVGNPLQRSARLG